MLSLPCVCLAQLRTCKLQRQQAVRDSLGGLGCSAPPFHPPRDFNVLARCRCRCRPPAGPPHAAKARCVRHPGRAAGAAGAAKAGGQRAGPGAGGQKGAALCSIKWGWERGGGEGRAGNTTSRCSDEPCCPSRGPDCSAREHVRRCLLGVRSCCAVVLPCPCSDPTAPNFSQTAAASLRVFV